MCTFLIAREGGLKKNQRRERAVFNYSSGEEVAFGSRENMLVQTPLCFPGPLPRQVFFILHFLAAEVHVFMKYFLAEMAKKPRRSKMN